MLFRSRLLGERRSADWLARRLASALVGDGGGQFIVFRRDRFTEWLAGEIHAGRPWDAIVRSLIASRGLWTDTPAVNFVTQAAADGTIDADKLAGLVLTDFGSVCHVCGPFQFPGAGRSLAPSRRKSSGNAQANRE